MRRNVWLIFTLIIAGSSCKTLTSLQTARTVKEEKTTAYLALGSQGIRFTKKSDNSNDRELESSLEKFRVPILEGGLRYGFGESWDAGARLALIPGTIGIDAKYALTSSQTPLGLATGIGLDYTQFGTESGDSSAKIALYDLIVPAYISWDFLEQSAVYFTPSFIYRISSARYGGGSTTPDKTETTPLFGVSTGVALGWFVAEYSFLSSMGGQSKSVLDQITLGIRLNVDALNHFSSRTADSEPPTDRTPKTPRKVRR